MLPYLYGAYRYLIQTRKNISFITLLTLLPFLGYETIFCRLLRQLFVFGAEPGNIQILTVLKDKWESYFFETATSACTVEAIH